MIATQVRVGIDVIRSAVRCPAGVPNTDVGIFDWVLFKLFNQNTELASALASLQSYACINHRDASRVITAIFQAL